MLPTSRNQTLNAGSPVPSALLNALQDAIIGAKRPAMSKCGFPVPLVTGNWAYSPGSDPPFLLSSGATPGQFALPWMEAGDRITGVTVAAFGNGVVDTVLDAQVVDGTMAGAVTLGTSTDTNRAAAWGDAAIGANLGGAFAAFVPHTLAQGEVLYLRATANAAAYRIGRVIVFYDRL